MSVSKVGSEILVNTATAGNQAEPQITTLANGGFVVTWLGSDGSSFGVKAQLFTAGGAPVGSEILVNTATSSDQMPQQITPLSNGGFVVTWTDASNGVGGAGGDSSYDAVKAQVFDAAGSPVGGEILVNTAVDNSQQRPEITALSNGGFVVTWEDYSAGVGGATGDGDSTAVKAQVFDATGAPSGSEILVNTGTAGEQLNSAVTPLVNGGFVITWQDNSGALNDTTGATGDGNNYAVKAQVFATSGAKVGSELRVNTATYSSQQDPEITALSNGGFVVTWTDSSAGVGGATGDTSTSAVKAQVLSATGAFVGSEILVNTATAGSQRAEQICALAGGGFVVTWMDASQGVGGATGDSSSTAIKAQVFTAAGARVGAEILVNTATASDQLWPRLTALTNGGFVVTWEDLSLGSGGATGDTSGYAVKAQVFTSSGGRVGSELLVNAATAGDQMSPAFTALPNGGFAVTWEDGSLGVGGAAGDSSGAAIKAQVFSVNLPPELAGAGGTSAFTEGAGSASTPVTVASGLTLSDGDSSTLSSATVSLSGGFQAGEDVLAFVNDGSTMGNVVGGYDSATGVLTLTSAGATATLAQWQAALRAITYTNGSQTPDTGARTVSFTVSDGTDSSAAATQTVTVAAANDRPALGGAGGTTAFTENGSAQAVASGVTVSDPDNSTLGSATVSITGGFHAGQDLLGFTNDGSTMGNVAASYDATSGVLTLTSSGGTATLAQWQAALRAVTYANSSEAPNTGARTVSFSISDGAASATAVTQTITLTAINDAPAGANGSATVAVGAAKTFSAADFGFSDVDGHALAAVKIATLPASGALTDDGAAVSAGQYVAVADIAAGKLVFTPAGAGAASFTFQVQDDGGVANGGADLDPSANAFTINVVASPPPPPPPAQEPTGTPGDDRLVLDGSQREVAAGAGDDEVIGAATNDTVNGNLGADTLSGGDGADFVRGGQGDDVVNGNTGDDLVLGDVGRDLLRGGQGDDVVNGNLGEDSVYGDLGADTVYGGQGDDVVAGGGGDDYLSGDLGDDTLSGGAGADLFRTFAGGGMDRVLDFNAAEGDRVLIDQGATYTTEQAGGDVLIKLSGGGGLVLAGVQLSSLGSGWILGGA